MQRPSATSSATPRSSTCRPARATSGKEVSNERAAVELDWRPETNFVEGARRFFEWRQAANGNGSAIERVPALVGAPAAAAVGGRVKRILVVSADIGEGHDLPARMLAAELRSERPGVEVAVVDGLAAMGGWLQKLIRDGSWFSFRRLPWLYEAQYFFLSRFAPTRRFCQWLGYNLTSRRMLGLIRSYRPDAVVSTYPGTTEVIGELRRRGRLDIPAYSAITDLAGLRFWAHRGIDLHLVTHRESIEDVEKIAGPGTVRLARAPTSAAFLAPRSRADARRALDLPAEGPVIVVSGGGWGMGDLRGAVQSALDIEDSTVVCITGRNEGAADKLRRHFNDENRVRIIGFTDRMSDLLAAADALIHSTAGLTVLEAHIRGCPVVSYGFGVGHIRANNAAYERFGLARVARRRSDLPAALQAALAEERARPRADPSAFTVVVCARGRAPE